MIPSKRQYRTRPFRQPFRKDGRRLRARFPLRGAAVRERLKEAPAAVSLQIPAGRARRAPPPIGKPVTFGRRPTSVLAVLEETRPLQVWHPGLGKTVVGLCYSRLKELRLWATLSPQETGYRFSFLSKGQMENSQAPLCSSTY